MQRESIIKTSALSCCLVVSTQAFGVAETADPRDYIPAPEGTNIGVLYADYLSGDDYYVNGQKVSSDSNLHLKVGAFRYIRFIDFLGFQANPQIVIPYAKAHLDLTGEDRSGMGDTLLAMTTWVVNKPLEKQWLSLGLWAWLPTGSYNSQHFLNIGNNRYSGLLSYGAVKGFGDNFYLSSAGEVEFYSDNKDVFAPDRVYGDRSKKENIYRINFLASYNLTPANYVWGKYYIQRGGKETINGISSPSTWTTGKLNNHTAVIGYSHWLAPTYQVQAEYARDLKIYNGIKTSGFSLRFVNVW